MWEIARARVEEIGLRIDDILSGADGRGRADGRIRLAADAVEIRVLVYQLGYDTSVSQAATLGWGYGTAVGGGATGPFQIPLL